ncbi:MAG: hypothetical protein JKY09_00920 [Crocinitomicaceae bacterium]|nr:hypothetical protein [Crocinitomicaceae bacterium]
MKKIVPIIGALILLGSCVKNNPDPAWLEVSAWQLENNPSGNPAGELTENISDAWVYIDDQLIGVFEVPFKIPVLLDGAHDIKLYPTIQNNGIAATKKIYPFLEPFEISSDLVKNEVLALTPTTKYYSSVNFTILDFEDANFGFSPSQFSLASLVASSDPTIIQPFNGGAFGRVVLNETDNVWITATNLEQNLPRGAEVYLEVDYHTTVDVVTGVLAINGSEVTENPNVRINGQDESEVEWKKIYIDIKTIVSGSPTAQFFEHSFQAVLGADQTTGVINIDNVKVVHF